MQESPWIILLVVKFLNQLFLQQSLGTEQGVTVFLLQPKQPIAVGGEVVHREMK